MIRDSKERILSEAKLMVQLHGYGGLNVRDLAQSVGIRAATIYHYFNNKADLATAVAKRYWQDSAVALEELSPDPIEALRRYPDTFRWALAADNRLCLASFMAAEIDDLPDAVKAEVLTTDWQNIVVFGNLRKYAARLKKGDRVYVEAEARNNNYERKVGAETVKFYETEFLAAAIERVAVRAEAEAEE